MRAWLRWRYDAQGRPTNWVYQQESASGFVEITKIKYTGNIVETSNFGQRGANSSMQIQALDPAGHVSDLRVSGPGGTATTLMTLYRARLEFDSKGRVTVQETDPYR